MSTLRSSCERSTLAFQQEEESYQEEKQTIEGEIAHQQDQLAELQARKSAYEVEKQQVENDLKATLQQREEVQTA